MLVKQTPIGKSLLLNNENPCSATTPTPRPLFATTWSQHQMRRNSPTTIAYSLQLQIWNLRSVSILGRPLKNGMLTKQLCVGGSKENSDHISNFDLRQNNAYRMHRKKLSLGRSTSLVNEECHL